MSDHKVTENIVNAGFQRSAMLSCSCGLSIEIADIRKLSLSTARRQLEGMHKNLVPENSPKPKKEKKPIKLTLEDEKVQDFDEDDIPNNQVEDVFPKED